jgi:TonB family protein
MKHPFFILRPVVLLITILLGLLVASCHEKSKGLSVAPYNQSDSTGLTTENTVTTTPVDTTTNTNTNTVGTMSDTSTHTARTTRMTRKGTVHTTIPAAPVNKTERMQPDAKGYYNYTQTSPAFPGGQSSLEDYINRQVTYPEDALENDVQGTVMVRFTIDENGKVGNVQTAGNQFGHGLEDAAMKVISQMPKWTPGTVNGKKVKGWYTIPVTFKIEE